MDPLKPGDPGMVGRYRLISRLGEGGMGRVFLGVSPGGRQVAVKLIHSAHANDRQFRERFTREIEAARKVGGFHTASVVDADPAADPPWMVTAYIHGSSLAEAVRERGPFSVDAVCALGAGLAEGLAAIHACGLVHRDLKPSNVILADDGPRIIDFGIARATGASRMTTAGMVVGTYSYMSPEQVRGETAGPASDVFSLGCTLAFATTAQSPFGDDSIITVVYRITSEPPDLSRVPTECGLRQLISECLAKNADERPSLNNILDRLTEGAPQAGFVPGPVPGYTPTPDPQPGQVPAGGPVRSDGGPVRSGGRVTPGIGPLAASADVTSPPADLYSPTHTMRGGERVAQDQSAGRVPDVERSGAAVGAGSGPGPGSGSSGPQGYGGGHGYGGGQGYGVGTGDAVTRQNISPPVSDAKTGPDWIEQRRGRRRPRRSVVIVASVAAVAVVGTIVGVLVSSGPKPKPHPTASGHASSPPATHQLAVPTAPLATLHDPNGKNVFGAQFSSNTVFASGDSNGNTYLWNVTTHQLMATLSDPTVNGFHSVNDIAYSPNSNTWVTADANSNVYLWNETGQLTATLANSAIAHLSRSANDSVAISPDGGFVAAGNQDGDTYLWGVAAGKLSTQPLPPLKDPGGKNVYGVAFSPVGNLLAAGDTNGSTYLWNVATGKLIATYQDPGSQGLYDVAFSPDGNLIAVSDSNGSGVVYLWSVATGKLVASLSNIVVGTGVYQDLAFSPNGKYIAVASTDGNLVLYSVARHQYVANLQDTNSQGLINVAWSPDGQTLAATDDSGDAFIWSMKWLYG